jgi:DNA (cytosine-5)-methyltransferase 1
MSGEQKSDRPDHSDETHPHPAPYTVGSLFAGIGGFCSAFKSAGFELLWANELDSFATQTYEHNFPQVRLIEKSIQELSVDQDELSAVDVITAGFPCQPFSVAGPKSGFADERGRLFFEITRLLKEFKNERPKIVILENVKHLLRHDKGRTFAKMSSEIQTAGYWFRTANATVLNTIMHTRIPQNRERLFMVAFNWDVFSKNDFVFPETEEGVDPLEDFLDLHERANDDLYFDENSKYGRMFVESMAKGDQKSVYILRRYYVRENKSNSVFTLTANMGDGGHNVPVIKDQWGIRKLTPRECARLQGFEEPNFHFPDELSKTQRYKQIGNAVTVPLVEKLAVECTRHLNALADAHRRSL